CRGQQRRLTAFRPSPSLSVTATGIAFWIHVSPRSTREEVGGQHGDALRVFVREPPAEGQANAACARVLAQALGVAKGCVALDLGARGRRKRVRVEGDAV